jgi:hypothetical protein
VDYGIIEFLVGIVTIVGFMYKFEKDTREEFRRDIGDLRERLTRVEDKLSLLAKVFTGQNGVMISLIDHLGRRGIIDDVDAWKTALSGIESMIINPLTEDEKRRLLNYIKKGKDEFTLNEADDFLGLARKFFEEHMDKEQAWYLLFYATAIHGIVHGRYERRATPPNPNP